MNKTLINIAEQNAHQSFFNDQNNIVDLVKISSVSALNLLDHFKRSDICLSIWVLLSSCTYNEISNKPICYSQRIFKTNIFIPFSLLFLVVLDNYKNTSS